MIALHTIPGPAPSRRRIVLAVVGSAFGLLALLGAAPGARASTPVAVFPISGDRVATRNTQIVIRGIPTSQLGTITVTGSKSGVHSGVVRADSDGDGGSFLPIRAFVAGELVTVKTDLDVIGARDGEWSFTVQTPAHPGNLRLLHISGAAPHAAWTFRTQPDLKPAAVTVTHVPHAIASGDLFLGPQAGPDQNGLEILNSVGHLVYFQPVPHGDIATDFRTQTDDGHRDLTWWQGTVNTSGIGRGVDEIENSSYEHVATVHAANGLDSDLHEFQFGPDATAWVTAYAPVVWDASKVNGGSRHQVVWDAVAQEIDLRTGLVLFQWDSLDHVALGASYEPVPHSSADPWDYFHINSIQPLSDGTVLISSRNTSAIYDLDAQTARVQWILGGKFSTFTLGAGARFYFQHDARMQSNGQITLFDDAGLREAQSRELTLSLNTTRNTATVAHQDVHDPALQAPAEGSAQQLSNGDALVGWGQAPDAATEFNAAGKVVFDAKFVGPNSSYRVYRLPWTGTPSGSPAIAIHTYEGQTTVSASWNGTTETAKWRILAGTSTKTLKDVVVDRKSRFETTMQTHRMLRDVEVQALNGRGQVLGTSRVATAN
jgi:hypothetical protein